MRDDFKRGDLVLYNRNERGWYTATFVRAVERGPDSGMFVVRSIDGSEVKVKPEHVRSAKSDPEPVKLGTTIRGSL